MSPEPHVYPRNKERLRRAFLILAVPVTLLLTLGALVGGLTVSTSAKHQLKALQAIKVELTELRNEVEELPTLQADIGILRAALGERDRRLAALEKGSEQPPSPDLKPLQERLNEVERQLNGLAGLKESMDRLKSSIVRSGSDVVKKADVDRLDREIKELKAQLGGKAETSTVTMLDGQLKKIKDKLEEYDKQQSNLGKQLRDSQAELAKAKQERDQRSPLESTDVFLLALHSKNLSLHNYLSVFRELVDPGKRLLPAGCRVGFGLAEGGAFDAIVPLKEAEGRAVAQGFARTGMAREGTTDRLGELGGEVAREFEGSKAQYRRCIVLASTACQTAPDAELKAWESLTVYVILIGRTSKARDLDADRLLQWNDFCRRCGGSLTLLSTPGNPEEPDKDLLQQLRSCLLPLLQPQCQLVRRK